MRCLTEYIKGIEAIQIAEISSSDDWVVKVYEGEELINIGVITYADKFLAKVDVLKEAIYFHKNELLEVEGIIYGSRARYLKFKFKPFERWYEFNYKRNRKGLELFVENLLGYEGLDKETLKAHIWDLYKLE